MAGQTPIEQHWHGTKYNDAERLGVTIEQPTERMTVHAEAVVVHFMTKDENNGNHNLYLDVIDENDQRVNGARLAALNTGNNMRLSAVIDKPVNEPGTNFVMHSQDTLNCWAVSTPAYGPISSDVVKGFHTRWGGVDGQDYGHVSFYVIFKLTRSAAPPPPVPPPHSDEYFKGFDDGFAAAKSKAIKAVSEI